MKNKGSFKVIISILFLVWVFNSCSNKEKETKPGYQQYNITVLLDLSDRIKPDLHPDQVQRDKEIILTVVDIIKQNIKSKGLINSFDKIKVIFYPEHEAPQFSQIASNLNIDFESLAIKDRKIKYHSIDSIFKSNLNSLYNDAVQQKNFSGADIWSFFKDEVNQKCIINKKDYHNYLIILTDGYIYWKYTKNSIKNRFTYILPNSNQVAVFRNDPNWQEKFDEKDYGLLKTGTQVKDLNVMVLEVNPVKEYPQDYDIIRKYLTKWFDEMGIKKDDFKILKTDYPSSTIPAVKEFLTKWK